MICDRCHILCSNTCPKCGRKKHIRSAEENEPVYLISLTASQAMLVEPILEASGVPYFKKGMIGGALAVRIGMMREIYTYYVPMKAFQECRETIENVFIKDETIMKLLHEFDA